MAQKVVVCYTAVFSVVTQRSSVGVASARKINSRQETTSLGQIATVMTSIYKHRHETLENSDGRHGPPPRTPPPPLPPAPTRASHCNFVQKNCYSLWPGNSKMEIKMHHLGLTRGWFVLDSWLVIDS